MPTARLGETPEEIMTTLTSTMGNLAIVQEQAEASGNADLVNNMCNVSFFQTVATTPPEPEPPPEENGGQPVS